MPRRPPASHTLWTDDVDLADPAVVVEADRYEDLGALGAGGMGEVRRVHDRLLGREVAMKRIRAVHKRSAAVARFVQEARATAQLQHPAIVPVYDVGVDAEGRPWFTMPVVEGETLRAWIARWPLRRLLETLLRVAEGVAYAHSRGVVHRDLKPENVMIGAFGEVFVLDWGLAALRPRGVRDPVLHSTAARTARGAVVGTPAYMAPEQAMGRTSDVGPAADVYALGAILYEMLAGRPPYEGSDAGAVVREVRRGPPPAVTGGPKEVCAMCEAAMAREPAERPLAAAFAGMLEHWLGGEAARAKADALVVQALDRLDDAARATRDAERLRDEARSAAERVSRLDSAVGKRPMWALEDGARARSDEAVAAEALAADLFQAALREVPGHPGATAGLADLYRARLRAAEVSRSPDVGAHRLRLRRHVGEDDPLVRGDAAVSLVTDPPRAVVEVHRFDRVDRRLVPADTGRRLRTPLSSVDLGAGSWLLVIHGPDGLVRYPVWLGSGEHWDGIPPGATSSLPVRLPRPGELDADDVYVPAGPAWLGGPDPYNTTLPWGRQWVDGFVMRRFPVTNAEYLVWLDELVLAGREEDALRHCPRERGGDLVYHRGPDGRFVLGPDADGDVWRPDWPVLLVDQQSAMACAEWSSRGGRPWRIPVEDEREKAARGVDGRMQPWGDHLDPTWCCYADSHLGRAMPASVHDWPADESVYGVRGVAGNCTDWCTLRPGAPFRSDHTGVLRGGAFRGQPSSIRCDRRHTLSPSTLVNFAGIRLARSFG